MAQRDKQGTPSAWQQLFDTAGKVAKGRFEGWLDTNALRGKEYDWPQEESNAFEYDFYLQYADLDLARFRGEAQKGYTAAAFSAMKVRARVIERILSGRVRLPRVKVPKVKDVKGKSLGPKAHTSNCELVCFVAERLVPFEQLRVGNLRPGRHGPKVWARLHEEWNRLHPHPLEHKNSGETVAREYRRAVAVTTGKNRYPTSLAREFLQQVQADFDEAWKPWKELRQANVQLRESLTDAERAKRKADEEAFMGKVPAYIEKSQRKREASSEGRAAEKLRQELRRLRQEHQSFLDGLSPERRKAYEEDQSLRDETERQQFRDSVPRRELVERRVMLLVRPNDDLSDNEKQVREAPLRDWFLIEARGGRGSFGGPWGRRFLSQLAPGSAEPAPSSGSVLPAQGDARTRRAARGSRTSRRPR